METTCSLLAQAEGREGQVEGCFGADRLEHPPQGYVNKTWLLAPGRKSTVSDAKYWHQGFSKKKAVP